MTLARMPLSSLKCTLTRDLLQWHKHQLTKRPPTCAVGYALISNTVSRYLQHWVRIATAVNVRVCVAGHPTSNVCVINMHILVYRWLFDTGYTDVQV